MNSDLKSSLKSTGVLQGMRFGFLLFALIHGFGCSPAYVLHAAVGQYRLINKSIPVEEALQKDALNPRQKEQLQLVALIKQFGEQELGLKPTRNYQTVYLESDQSPLYVISAAPKDKLLNKTWWFPIIGHVPYLSYFHLEKARAKKEKLLKKDLDVIVGTADAYSTLGWFQDPVTLNLLDDSTVTLAETILHEMTHTTLYLNGQAEFNEGLAMLVGREGALLFVQAHAGAEHPWTLEARQRIDDQRLFSEFLSGLLDQLEMLYSAPISYEEKIKQRQVIFNKGREEFALLQECFRTSQFTAFGQAGLNNAYLLAVGLYHRHFAAFEKCWQQHDHSLSETIRFFQALAEKRTDILVELKKQMP